MKATDVLKKKRGISISFTIDLPDYGPSAAKSMKKRRKPEPEVEKSSEIPMVRSNHTLMAG